MGMTSSSTVFAAFGGFLIGAGTTLAWTYLLGNASGAKHHKGWTKKGFSSNSSYAAASSVERSDSFLTDLLAALWKQINAAASAKIQSKVEPLFKDLLGPVAKMRFTKVCLGQVPLRLDNIVVHECSKNSFGREYVQFELDFIWDGDCDIQLEADYIGSFGVKSIKLAGRMSIVLQPLMNVLPIVGAVQYAFINTPDLELDFTGLAQVADITAIKTTIRTTILESIEGMMVLPNRSRFLRSTNHLWVLHGSHCSKGAVFEVRNAPFGKLISPISTATFKSRVMAFGRRL
jgi:Synaptotagmin-like mitochondrial-lipid-binding domain